MAIGKRVLLVHNIIAPYRLPLFRALADRVNLTVWFMSETARNRRWRTTSDDLGFKYRILPDIQINHFTNDLFTYTVNPTFPLKYARTDFDVMISAGWLDFASQTGFALSKLLGRKFILWSESTAHEPSWRRTIARPLVQTLVKGSDACVSVGTRSREYLLSLGATPSKTFTAFSTVDVDHFSVVSKDARRNRAALKARLGISRGRVVLFSGQLIQRKGVQYLVDAFTIAKARQPDLALMILGYGPLRDQLVGQVHRRRLQDVHFVDHVEVAEIPAMYAAADVLVLPSLEETWGLVVNEAMACGLPVIATDRVGSSVDLIKEGVNGYVVPPADPAALAEAVLRLTADDATLARFSENSRRAIRQFTPDRAADGFLAAIEHACQAGREPARPMPQA
jgi:glycosyltransferase involved in cell wall biosynthesis